MPHPLDMKSLILLLRPYRRELLQGYLIALFALLLSVPTPLFVPMLIDEVLLHKPGFLTRTLSPFYENAPLLFYVGVVLAVVTFLRLGYLALGIWQYKIFTHLSKEITLKLRARILEKLERSAIFEFERLGGAHISARLLHDLEVLDDFIALSSGRFLLALLSLLGIGLVLLFIHVWLGLFILLLNPLVVLASRRIAQKVGRLKREENRAKEAFQVELEELFSMIIPLRVHNLSARFFEYAKERALLLKEASDEYAWKSEAAGRFSRTIFLLGYELFRVVSILMVAYSDLSIGLMLAVFGYLWYMMTPIQELISAQYAYHNAKAALERLNELLALPEESPLATPRARESAPLSLQVKNLSFAFPNMPPLFEGVNMEIRAGEKVALIGASGSGKSTLAGLIVGLYQPLGGEILYNGKTQGELGLEAIRERVMLLLQEPRLFNETLRFNLTLGKEFEESALYEALRIAQLEPWLKSLPEGLETPLGRFGVRLSGGQRQRVMLARLILAKPDLIIFDESTSALDLETEERVYELLLSHLQGTSMLFIAHRPSTIRRAERIYQMSEGRVEEF